MPQRAQREAAGLAGVLKTKSALLAWLEEQGQGKRLNWAKAVQYLQALDCELPPDKTGGELQKMVMYAGANLRNRQLGKQPAQAVVQAAAAAAEAEAAAAEAEAAVPAAQAAVAAEAGAVTAGREEEV